MTRATYILLCLGLVASWGLAGDFGPVGRESAVRESLAHVSRKQWASWLEHHGYDASRYATYRRPETTGLRLVGKYGRGPSVEVMAQDTLMALTLGSECALLNIANSDKPRVISEIQLDYLPRQSLLKDTLLLTGGNGIQIWSIARPTQPVRLSEIPYAIGDFSIVDTFLYFISGDTFFAYSFANPASPHRIGFCVDSGYVTSATRNTAVLIQPNDVLGFVDVSDPAHPHQVGIWPAWPLAATARGNLCCGAFADPANLDRSWLLTLDISDPSNPRQLARVDSVCGFDIFLSETLAFVSGRDDAYDSFRIVNIADSTRPKKLGMCDVWNDNWGVWADVSHNRAYIASEPSGLAVVDIADQNAPHVDTCVMTADLAGNICVDGNRAYISDYRAGFRILDVSDPAHPVELGGYDTLHRPVDAVAAKDSFAFVSWWATPYFRTFDVSDPSHPMAAGGGIVETTPEDMVLRDTLIYLVGRLRFNVVNVARPRQPILEGSCVTNDGQVFRIALQETLAFVAGGGDVQVINVADPASPRVIADCGQYSFGLALRDTFIYIPYVNDTLLVYSIADPTNFHLLSAVPAGVFPTDAALGESMVYVSGVNGIDIYALDNPALPAYRGSAACADAVARLRYSDGLLYAAIQGAGVAIYETTAVGISERRQAMQLGGARVHAAPDPVRDHLSISGTSDEVRAAMYDAVGRLVSIKLEKRGGGVIELNTVSLRSGVYFVELEDKSGTEVIRIVKP
jgi:hypothetical protein